MSTLSDIAEVWWSSVISYFQIVGGTEYESMCMGLSPKDPHKQKENTRRRLRDYTLRLHPEFGVNWAHINVAQDSSVQKLEHLQRNV